MNFDTNQTDRALHKIYRSIKDKSRQGIKINDMRELEYLEAQCRMQYQPSALPYLQVYQRLVQEGVIPPSNALTTLLAIIPNSSSEQCYVLVETVISVLLYGLKQYVSLLKPDEQFAYCNVFKVCQHPLIKLIQKSKIHTVYVAEKIKEICTHHDKEVRTYSIDFLKPVFLHMLCDSEVTLTSRIVWNELLSIWPRSQKHLDLIKEVIILSQVSSSHACFCTSAFVVDTLNCFTAAKNYQDVGDLVLYLLICINQQIVYGINPESSIRNFIKILNLRIFEKTVFNAILVIFSKTLHIISHLYIYELLRIIFTTIVEQLQGNQYVRNMILDGLISWMSHENCTPISELSLIHPIVKSILNDTPTDLENIVEGTISITSNARLYHDDVSITIDIVQLTAKFKQADHKNVFLFIDMLKRKENLLLNKKLNLFLRSIFLSKNLSLDCWFKVFELTLSIVKGNEQFALDFLPTFLFKLSMETIPEIQMELMRSLPFFAIAKNNIPTILKTINALSKGNYVHFCMDLHLKLWKIEKRTYPFLLQSLSAAKPRKSSDFEYYTVKASVIREICVSSASNCGLDLIPHITEILNVCLSPDGDLPTAIAIDAVISLCRANIVSAISTWKALNGRFRQETRPYALKSILEFYSCLPLSCKFTVENEKIMDDVLDQLWLVVDKSNDIKHIQTALLSLASFVPGKHMFLKHLPKRFRFENKLGKQINLDNDWDNVEPIPGECWIQLLRNVNPIASKEAADLISNYIELEIADFRGGVYDLSNYKSEPKKLSLRKTSPLLAVTNYLIRQSSCDIENTITEKHVITYALRTISRNFSKPIPHLDWNFLRLYFFQINFEARKYCILLSTNQATHSESAKMLLENYLLEFEPNCFEEDLLFLMSLFMPISNSVALNILRAFMMGIAQYCFNVSQIHDFSEGCLFEKFLKNLKYVFIENQNPEISDMLSSLLQRYLDSAVITNTIFKMCAEVISTMPHRAIESLTSPSTWWEVSIENLKKATIIRCNLILMATRLDENPLKWLNPLIDVFMERTNEKDFFLENVAVALYDYKDERSACNWIMDLLNRAQNLSANEIESAHRESLLFLIDVIKLSIMSFSGYGILFCDIGVISSWRSTKKEMFVQSLLLLFEKPLWKENIVMMIEAMHKIFASPVAAEQYSNIIKELIIRSRNISFIDEKYFWVKYEELSK